MGKYLVTCWLQSSIKSHKKGYDKMLPVRIEFDSIKVVGADEYIYLEKKARSLLEGRGHELFSNDSFIISDSVLWTRDSNSNIWVKVETPEYKIARLKREIAGLEAKLGPV